MLCRPTLDDKRVQGLDTRIIWQNQRRRPKKGVGGIRLRRGKLCLPPFAARTASSHWFRECHNYNFRRRHGYQWIQSTRHDHQSRKVFLCTKNISHFPFKGFHLASRVVSRTTEIQGHRQVCHAWREGPRTPSKNSWRKPWICVFWKRTFPWLWKVNRI